MGVTGQIDGVRERGDLSQLDLPLLAWLVAHRQSWATTALTGVTTVGGEVVLVVVPVGAHHRHRGDHAGPVLPVAARRARGACRSES